MGSLPQIRVETHTMTNGPKGPNDQPCVRWLTLDNPARKNALNERMWNDLPKLIRSAAADPAVRAIVVTGAGTNAFSAGADISEFEDFDPIAQSERHDNFECSAFAALLACPKPTIAMIQGICFGGGCELALCCDFRIVADTARFAIPAAKLGVGYNARWIRPLLNVVGPAKAKEILMTARTYDAIAAERMGLATEVVSPQELRAATDRLLVDLSANAPMSMAAAKTCIDSLAHPPAPVEMLRLDQAVQACFLSRDFAEGRRAFMEKRKPKFSGE